MTLADVRPSLAKYPVAIVENASGFGWTSMACLASSVRHAGSRAAARPRGSMAVYRLPGGLAAHAPALSASCDADAVARGAGCRPGGTEFHEPGLYRYKDASGRWTWL